MKSSEYGIVSEESMASAFRVGAAMLLGGVLAIGMVAYEHAHKKNQPAPPSRIVLSHKNKPTSPNPF